MSYTQSHVLCGAGRGVEVVESTVRQHIGACFSSLEQKVLGVLSDASQRLASNSSADAQDKPLLQVGWQEAQLQHILRYASSFSCIVDLCHE